MTEKNFNPSIHGLRGFAAISVVLFHIWASGIDDNFLPDYIPKLLETSLTSLSYGVELFFMISGYLIAFSVLGHKKISSFLFHRCIRIYPAFLPVLLLIFIFGPFIGYDYFETVKNFTEWAGLLVANILFLPGIFPMDPALLVAWTLSYEAAFYVFCAICCFFYRISPHNTTRIGIVISSLILCYFFPPAVFFGIGAIVYFFKDKLSPTDLINKHSSLWLIPLFFLLLLTFHTTKIAILQIPVYLVGLILFAGIARQQGSFSSILNNRYFQFFGTISYSLYLWHTPIMFVTKRLSLKFFSEFGDTTVLLVFGITSLLISLPVAWVSYMIFENFTPRLLKKHYNA